MSTQDPSGLHPRRLGAADGLPTHRARRAVDWHCSLHGTDHGAQKNDKSEQAQLFQVNPSPKHVFEVEFEIHDAPGPLMAVRGSAGYSAPHAPNCTFVTNAWAGTWGTPFKGLNLPVMPAGTNRFVMTVALDGSHSMHHFVGLDAAGQPDRSILGDPQARHLAQQQSGQIGE